ncbi:PD-(D/E)XK nuclease family protein [Vibrio sp. HN007]|uniref:PDDEXK-like family protein n=1 Tax=Vibrio iocasae TaxID=3098914 RepID=UPI0035D46209
MKTKKMIKKMRELLKRAESIPNEEPNEPTIFSIGSKGYYENPTTDILAFFTDNNASHGLGSLVLKSIIQCLPDQFQKLDCSLTESPEREVATKSGKRIDLLLEGEQWVIILENKVFHEQNNPFEEYENFLREERNQDRFDGKQAIFVVLSPTGQALKENWHGISYIELISTTKHKLAEHFIDHPLNKWTLLLREFLMHLETMMSKPTTSEETISFVLENLTAIKNLQDMKKNAVNDYHRYLQLKLQQSLEQTVNISLNHWDSMPALRFSLDNWAKSNSDVVLYLDGNPDESHINFYAELLEKNSTEFADKYIDTNSCTDIWVEQAGKFRGYQRIFKGKSESDILSELKSRLQQLDNYEQAARS